MKRTKQLRDEVRFYTSSIIRIIAGYLNPDSILRSNIEGVTKGALPVFDFFNPHKLFK